MRCILIILFVVIKYVNIYAQDSITLTLDKLIEIAQEQSYDAKRLAKLYTNEVLSYEIFKSSLLPDISLSVNPANYSHTITKRYDFEENVEVYREQLSLTSFSNLSLYQTIPLTGGQLFLNTDVERFSNEENQVTYRVVPFNIGINQPLFQFNDTKWSNKLIKTNLEHKKQELISNLQGLNLKAVDLFFRILLSEQRLNMEKTNLLTIDTLYTIAKTRYENKLSGEGTVLQLEVMRYNSMINKAVAEKELEEAVYDLNVFLGYNLNTKIKTIVPGIDQGFTINYFDALKFANANSLVIAKSNISKLEIERDYEKSSKAYSPNVNISAKLGQNQSSPEISELYQDPLNQQMINISLDIPLVNWGKSGTSKKIFQNRKEILDIENEKYILDQEKKIIIMVKEFNKQSEIVNYSSLADSASNLNYVINKNRFAIGKIDARDLSTSISERSNTRNQYLKNVYLYWKYYYALQKETFYNFIENESLDVVIE